MVALEDFILSSTKKLSNERENFKMVAIWLETNGIKVISEEDITSIGRKAPYCDITFWNFELKTYLDTEVCLKQTLTFVTEVFLTQI